MFRLLPVKYQGGITKARKCSKFCQRWAYENLKQNMINLIYINIMKYKSINNFLQILNNILSSITRNYLGQLLSDSMKGNIACAVRMVFMPGGVTEYRVTILIHNIVL